ncbi:helix-turn-helix domain-containing protein [Micromonospora arborensis]|uniref:helix-turn-helix domain-containing protein n=1 Tax=Micromonospora arborensis TaxID=2116518 RepID=UPI00370F9C57
MHRTRRGERTGPAALHIARLVAAGARSNEVAAQLFVSPRTVDTHLRNNLRKLGIREDPPHGVRRRGHRDAVAADHRGRHVNAGLAGVRNAFHRGASLRSPTIGSPGMRASR